MKYLKLFEDIDKDEYEELSREQFKSYVVEPYNKNIDYSKPVPLGERFLKFSTSEVRILSKLGFKDCVLNRVNKDYQKEFKLDRYSTRFVRGGDVAIFDTIIITKILDDWFFIDNMVGEVKTRGTGAFLEIRYFRCDQIDGLLKCLKNEFGI